MCLIKYQFTQESLPYVLRWCLRALQACSCPFMWGLIPSCIWVILRPWVFPAGVCFSVWISSLLLTLPNHFLTLKCYWGTWAIFYLGRWSSSPLENLHGATLWSKKSHFLPTSGFCSFLLLDLVWMPLEVNEVSHMSVSKRQLFDWPLWVNKYEMFVFLLWRKLGHWLQL